MNLGKPPQGRDHSQKWSYQDFYNKIVALQTSVQNLEIQVRDLEIDCAQFRLALAGAQAELFNGLTKNPFPFNAELQKVWDAGIAQAMKDRGLKRVGRTEKALNWDKDKTIPY